MVYVEIFCVTVNLYAQIVGTVGLVVIVWSYQLKKTAYLALSTLAMAIFLAESCLLYADADTFTGIVLNAAAIVRNLLMLRWRALRTRTARPDRPLSSCRRLGRMRLSSHGMVHLPSARSADGVYPVFPLQKLLRSESRRPRTGERNLFYNASVGAYIGILRQVVLVISVIVSTIAYASALRRQKSADISAARRPAADCNENPSKTAALADDGSYCKSSLNTKLC